MQNEKLLSISADGMLLREFVRYVAREGNVSIVVEDGLDERTITMDVQSQGVNDILAGVARRLGVQVTRTGSLFFVGELRPEDKGVLVRRVGRLSREDLSAAVGTLASETGKVVVDVDGLLIVADRVEVLRRMDEMVDQIESAEAKSWVVQLYVIGLSRRAVNDLGIDFAPALSVAVSYASANDPSTLLKLDAALNAILDYEQLRGDIMTLASPTFVVRDGDPARVFVGDQIPVPRRSTSDQGTVTTEGYDTVEAGLAIDVDVRQVGNDQGLLNLEIARSRVKSFVEAAPVVSTEEFKTKAVVKANGVYLLGELSRGDFESTEGGSFRFGRREVDNWDTIQIWARTHAIDAPALAVSGGQDAPAEIKAPTSDVGAAEISVYGEAVPAAAEPSQGGWVAVEEKDDETLGGFETEAQGTLREGDGAERGPLGQ